MAAQAGWRPVGRADAADPGAPAEQGRPVGVTALATCARHDEESDPPAPEDACQAAATFLQAEETDRYGSGPASQPRPPDRRQHSTSSTPPAERCATCATRSGISASCRRSRTDGVRVLATVPGKSLVEIGVRRGSLLSFPRLGAGQGRARLRPRGDARRACSRSRLELLTPKTIVSATRLAQELERIRARGWAVGPERGAHRASMRSPLRSSTRRHPGRHGRHRRFDPVHRGGALRASRSRDGEARPRGSRRLGYRGHRAGAHTARQNAALTCTTRSADILKHGTLFRTTKQGGRV